MRHQPKACASDLGDDQSHYLFRRVNKILAKCVCCCRSESVSVTLEDAENGINLNESLLTILLSPRIPTVSSCCTFRFRLVLFRPCAENYTLLGLH